MSNKNLDALWMPFTPNRAFKEAPRFVESAEGVYLTTKGGRQVIDATAGLWCTNAGHSRPEIAEAVNNQLRKLDFTSSFNFTTIVLAFSHGRAQGQPVRCIKD